LNKKILYFEAPDGISGDMTLGALIDLGANAGKICAELDKFVPEPYELIPHPFDRNGIHGINLDVIVEGEGGSVSGLSVNSVNGDGLILSHGPGHSHGHADDHVTKSDRPHGHPGPGHSHGHADDHVTKSDRPHGHRHYSDIVSLIEGSGLTARAKGYALAIFSAIADGEAAVHRVPKADVAFHEVGAMDSIIDIVGTAIAVDLLGVEEFYCGALHDGSGTILCQHGVIPVPAPAVMEMARGHGIPIVIEDAVKTEMITPTGFGIIKGLNAKFEPRLGLVPEKTGYGFGKRDTGRLGAVRVTLGTLYCEEVE